MRQVFIDTNIIVYLEDTREPAKRAMARALWPSLVALEGTMISSQVASETVNTMLRLWNDADVVRSVIDDLEGSMWIVPVTFQVVRLAIDGCARFGFSFYDAQIWAAAREWGATLVLSEDFADSLVADGVRFANPFAPGFELDALLA